MRNNVFYCQIYVFVGTTLAHMTTTNNWKVKKNKKSSFFHNIMYHMPTYHEIKQKTPEQYRGSFTPSCPKHYNYTVGISFHSVGDLPDLILGLSPLKRSPAASQLHLRVLATCSALATVSFCFWGCVDDVY